MSSSILLVEFQIQYKLAGSQLPPQLSRLLSRLKKGAVSWSATRILFPRPSRMMSAPTILVEHVEHLNLAMVPCVLFCISSVCCYLIPGITFADCEQQPGVVVNPDRGQLHRES